MRRAARAGALAAALLAGCGGGGQPAAATCTEKTPSGVRIDSGQLPAQELCAARGEPVRTTREAGEVVWDYGCGVTYAIEGELARLRIDRDALDLRCTSKGSSPPRATELELPPGQERGRLLFAQTGCLACHQLGGSGTDGPGPELTGVGARLSAREIRRVLVAPKLPMPSFATLPRADLDALTSYLSALR